VTGARKGTGPTPPPYYQCRFPAEYALANRVQHPVNVYLREDQLTGEVNGWLAREFAPHRLRETVAAMAAAQLAEPAARPDEHEETIFTYMINITLTTEFVLPPRGAW
jgi:hypothetical protein